MAGAWYDDTEWDDTQETGDGTHACRVCGYRARIETPQRRTEHYCRECDTWRRFESILSDSA